MHGFILNDLFFLSSLYTLRLRGPGTNFISDLQGQVTRIAFKIVLVLRFHI